jgi:hypothetical protein
MRDGIGVQFIDRCHGVLNRQLTDVHPIISSHLGTRVPEVTDWIGGQHHSQREPLRWIQDMSTHICVTLSSNAIDNTFALIDLLDQPENKLHEWAYLTIARAVAESATLFAHLTDREVLPEQRLLRSAAMVIQGRLDEAKLVRDLDDGDALARNGDEWTRLLARIEKAGMQLRRNRKDDIIGVQRGTEYASLNVNITEESARRFTRAVAPYRIASAVTHSAWWYLASSMTREGDQMVVKLDINNMVNSVVIVLDALEVMAAACAGPEQSDVSTKFSATTDRRVQIVLKSRQLA